MSFPKRPFTTSSLTSTLKSTIASQPLLSNLTNIDKLSSQASSLAQKTPFFGVLNSNLLNQHHNDQTNVQYQQSSGNSQTGNHINPSQAGSGGQSLSSQSQSSSSNMASSRQTMASKPAVDMSHLTEEERLMIQSVMAKAEMADMGIAVDTSQPSSTNLPSNASAALAQQAKQQQQPQGQHPFLQQRQQFINNDDQNRNPVNPIQQQQPQNSIPQNNFSDTNQSQFGSQQLGSHQQALNNSMQIGYNNLDTSIYNQPYAMQQNQQLQQQTLGQQSHLVSQQMMQPNTSQQSVSMQSGLNMQPSSQTSGNLPMIEQQTQDLVNRINSQFNLNQSANQANYNQQTQQQIQMQQQLPDTSQSNISSQQQPLKQPQLQAQQRISGQQNQQYAGQQLQQQQQFVTSNMQISNTGQPIQQQFHGQMIINPLDSRNGPQGPFTSQPTLAPTGSIDQGFVQQATQQINPTMQTNQQVLNDQSINHSNQFGQTFQSSFGGQTYDNISQLNVTQSGFPKDVPQPIAIKHDTLYENVHIPQNNINQRDNLLHNPIQPNTVAQFADPYRNNIPRSEIRFGPQSLGLDQDYEHSFSDTENSKISSRRNNHRNEFKRYDSADPSSRRSDNLQMKETSDLRETPQRGHIGRQLPQPTQSERSLQSSTEQLQAVDRQQMSSRIKRSPNKVVQPVHGDNRRQKNLRETRTDSESDSPVTREPTRSKNYQLDNPKEKEVSKSDAADSLRLMSEVKLAEQASQVMEHQKMLIKQSQELIKLQLEQQVLSQELKKSMRKTESPRVVEEKGVESDETCRKEQTERRTTPENELTEKKTDEKQTSKVDDKAKHHDKVSSSTAKAETIRKSDIVAGDESDTEESPRALTQHSSRFTEGDVDSHSVNSNDNRRGRPVFREREVKTADKATSAEPQRPTSAITRYNRDILMSPPDTTDSEMEPNTQATLRSRSRPSQTRPARAVTRRREPTGLPPSPLPVAAAIQLHQMQQQHFKTVANRTASTGLRNNFIRSRSVTSSPSQHLDGGYVTEGQRLLGGRSVSPDTLSEFGGQRRRKRLPEPPTNAIPTTPAMVRKMIQAQRAGFTGKIPTSVNVQTTHFSNTHTNRMPSLDRQPNLPIKTARHHLGSTMATNMDQDNNNNNPKGVISSKEMQTGHQVLGRGDAELNKFLTSTYGSGILKGTISDVRETPELDKLIGNFDEYIESENKKSVQFPLRPVDQSYPSASDSIQAHSRLSHVAQDNAFGSDGPYGRRTGSLSRRSSEGESSFGARLARNYYNQSSYLSQDYPNPNNYPVNPVVEPNSYLCATPLRKPRQPVSRAQDYPSDLLDDRRYRLTGPGRISFGIPPRSSYVGSGIIGQKSKLPGLAENEIVPPPLVDRCSILNNTQPNLRYSTYRNIPNQRGFMMSPIDGSKYSAAIPEFGGHEFDETTSRYRLDQRNVDTRRSRMLNRSSNRFQNRSLDLDPRYNYYNPTGQHSSGTIVDPMTSSYYGDVMRTISPAQHHSSSHIGQYQYRSSGSNISQYPKPTTDIVGRSSFAPLTKDDIINNGPKFDSIGYRYRTENQNKYSMQSRIPAQTVQFRYPFPYMRILLSKNPKDKIGNGIGLRITGGQPMPSLYDRVNKCIITSGAFVTEVFQNSNVYFMGEISEGDQVIEWNGVNLCNRSDQEVHQILLSQFSDDEVEIVYLKRDKLAEAYGLSGRSDTGIQNHHPGTSLEPHESIVHHPEQVDFAETRNSRYGNDSNKGSLRHRLSFSSLANMWSR